MKKLKIIIVFALLVSAIVGCRKESYVAAFEDLPQKRMADTIAFVNSTLTGAPNGWVGVMPTNFGGGFGFYMTFDAVGNVTMNADLSDASAATSYKSQYRVKADMGAALVFDTYNYITELNDPDNSVRNGFGGDLDYIYDHTSGDTLFFWGKRYRKLLTLIKATAAEKAVYNAGDYLKAINGFKQFFTTNKNAFITLENGTKISVEPNMTTGLTAGKRVTLTALTSSGLISSATSKFAFTTDKLALLDSGINVAGNKFVRIAWKNTTQMAVYTAEGKEYIINNAAVPILPLYMLMGVKYNALFSNYKTIYPGTTADGATILNYYHNNLNNASILGYSFNWGSLRLSWDLTNKRVSLIGFSSQNGGTSGWNTTAIYRYTVDANGNYKFTSYSTASGGYVTNILTQMNTFLLNNTVNLDYYVDASSGTVYGKMSSVEVPTTAMTFVLQ